MGYFIGGILGFVLGLGLAAYLTVTLVKKSNDIGDSTGSLSDFGSLHLMMSEDDLHNCRPSGRGEFTLKEIYNQKLQQRGNRQ